MHSTGEQQQTAYQYGKRQPYVTPRLTLFGGVTSLTASGTAMKPTNETSPLGLMIICNPNTAKMKACLF